MRIFYSLILTASYIFSLQAQSSLELVSNVSSFYITDTSCDDENPFDGIIWPCDFETINCEVLSDPSITGEPIINNKDKNYLRIDFEDISFKGNEILRKWTVVDLRFQNQEVNGSWEYFQKLSVLKSNPPKFISNTSDQEFCIYKYDCSPDYINLKANAIDDCTNEASIVYNYEIDLQSDGKIDFSGNSSDASDIFPYGRHKIKWIAKDGCGNKTQCEYFFEVKDCSPPISTCVNGLMVELDSLDRKVIVGANAFDQNSFDNCAIEEYRIVTPSRGEEQIEPPSSAMRALTFDCALKGVNSVDFWVKDKSGNWSYCTTYVIVSDNGVDCEKRSDDYKSLSDEINRFVEEYPIEIDKMFVPENEIVQPNNAAFKVFPSQPNPFDGETEILFELTSAATLNLIVQDASGKVIKNIEKEFFAGLNKVKLQREDFNEAGVYFFTLKSKTHKATGKLILIQR